MGITPLFVYNFSARALTLTLTLTLTYGQSKTKSTGLKLTFDIKDITLAEITITTSYYFFGDFTVLLKPFLDER